MEAPDSKPSSLALESRIREIGGEIFERARAAEPGVFQLEWWQRRAIEWTMHDAGLRSRLFRFVDVLPALASSREIARHLHEYLGDGAGLPAPLAAAINLGPPDSLAGRAAALAARRNARSMARRFIAGETAEEAASAALRLRRRGMAFTLDLLGEATTSEAQADDSVRQYMNLIATLRDSAEPWRPLERLDAGARGPIPRVNLSLKLTALHSQFDAISPGRALAAVGARLRPILRLAREAGAFVNIDMERREQKDLILSIFKSVLMEDEFRDFAGAGIVIQAYLKESERDLLALADWARRRGHPITVRLVKGAYWDQETIHAAQRGWPSPVFGEKWESDASFERLSAILLDNRDATEPAFASHNVRSLAAAIAQAERRGLPPRGYEIQMLYGMGDALKAAIVEMGMRLRVYTPFGPLIPGMAYLIRRLLENTSNDSFLRQSFSEHAPIEELLKDPAEQRGGRRAAHAPDAKEEQAMTALFQNEPWTDFSLEENRAAMAAAMEDAKRLCGQSYPLVINGEPVHSARSIESNDPSHPERVVGRASMASAADADLAVEAARAAWPGWRRTPVEERGRLLRALADAMARRRMEFAAWIILEAGKPWREADADVAEAIDFCRYYAMEAERLQGAARRRDVPGEENRLIHEPRGVAAIIAPWNFPMAILAGMTAAALATGNCAVVKPAEQTPVVAAKFFELIAEAGFPPGVASLLHGLGEEAGARLVAHPGVDIIAFTGSRAVGLGIMEEAAKARPGQKAVKRVIAEMGGKNAIIIDDDADLDDAVAGVAASAFSYAGQKCSACSRAIVVKGVHDAFVKRLVAATRSLRVGPADEPATFVGPVIDAEALARIRGFIEQGKDSAELACQVETAGEGFLVGPAIFDRVPPASAIAQEEIFGPVLCVIEAENFGDALAIANDTDYALTGGVYSRSPSHIELAKEEFRVGNLYINRGVTGALVDRQPFGGFKLSGSGGKAGGPDYIPLFCEARTITENTMRHGFAPQA